MWLACDFLGCKDRSSGDYSLGNAREHSLAESWNGQRARRFRERRRERCLSCCQVKLTCSKRCQAQAHVARIPSLGRKLKVSSVEGWACGAEAEADPAAWGEDHLLHDHGHVDLPVVEAVPQAVGSRAPADVIPSWA